ncbi:MAG: type I DNA topoisomerase [Anaerolineae bacterium]|nr:type I DNA topoisomerase [Anaerolineae bacterium]
MPERLEAYCMKCRAKREIVDPEPVFTANGRPATRGRCPVCGATLFRMGETPAHADLERPDVSPAKPRQKARKSNHSRASSKRQIKLVIVESPAKARTVGRYLGRGYVVRASVGHVRDLLRSQLSVDIEHDFQPKYRVPNEKREIVKELKKEVKRAREVYLATDPDREGEAIAWHLVEATGIEPEQVRRVVFHEITRPAVERAFAQPRDIDMNLVNAQQARRILDRLVGYQVSPLLWSHVRNRTSAGRVQSVALRLIVEREREIEAFVPEEYWSIEAELARQESRGRKRRPSFTARLVRIRGQEVDLKNEEDTNSVVRELERSTYVVSNVKRGQRRRRPAAPFRTSTLQQEASRRLRFTARRTMAVAQALYEGIELGDEGTVGLITYMRTDSTNVSPLAQEEARRFVAERYGEEFLPPKPPSYRTRAKGAQEAHEAIRPTSVYRTPESVAPYLNRDQLRLYDLIWKRFVASQMADAIYDTMTVDVVAGPAEGDRPYLLRASGSAVRFSGFLAVYEESRDEDAAADQEAHRLLPPVVKGEELDLLRLSPEQHFTQPPPRYTDATLIRALEEHGIGRPSTYASILSTIQQRGYVERIDRRLHPTKLGITVCDLLVQHFPDVFEVGFTARMESDLDRIAAGEADWVQVLRDFYGPFSERLAEAERTMERRPVEDEPTGEICELCGHPMVVKYGRYGKFLACSNYPACRNTKPYLVKIGVRCPKCGSELVERRTRRGRVFYGCSAYPACDFSTWQRPLPTPCPSCGGLLVVSGKHTARCLQCGEEFELDQLEQMPVAEPG